MKYSPLNEVMTKRCLWRKPLVSLEETQLWTVLPTGENGENAGFFSYHFTKHQLQ